MRILPLWRSALHPAFLLSLAGACTHGQSQSGTLAMVGSGKESDAGGDAARSAAPDSSAPSSHANEDGGAQSFGDAGLAGAATGCKPLSIAAGAAVDGTPADTFHWFDRDCQPRSAALLRNDAQDAFGEHGGYLRAYSYVAHGKARQITGTFSSNNTWNGFGYVVNHYANTASLSQQTPGTYRTLLAGPHHAIHEFKLRVNPGGPVDVTVHWFFATGRSHPLYAITFDASPAGMNTVYADTRAPYGDMLWDDGKGGDVDGLGWGDAYQFITTDTLSPHASWDYTKLNVIPYDFEWSTGTDAEMGLVSTESYTARIQGGDYGGGLLTTVQGKTGMDLLADAPNGLPAWLWPFQLNQYELPSENNSHRICWGATYGAVGQSSYTAFGKTLSGYPYQSYTVAVVLGTHEQSAIFAAVADMESVQKTTLSAARGRVAQDGAAGVNRTDKASYAVVGFDPVYAAWTLDAEQNAATFTLDTHGASLRAPLIVLRGYRASAAPARVMLGDQELRAERDYFATVDAAQERLWLTLNGDVEGKVTLTIE